MQLEKTRTWWGNGSTEIKKKKHGGGNGSTKIKKKTRIIVPVHSGFTICYMGIKQENK
jgi:hypothetical protein